MYSSICEASAGFSFFAYLSVAEWLGIAINAAVGIFVAVIVTSIAFLLQKTILLKLAEYINKKWQITVINE